MISFWNQARNVGSFTVKKCFFSDQSSTKNQAIFDSVVNRAFRHVYFRTLPLRRQPELKGREKEICDNIETEARVLCWKHRDRIVDERSAAHIHLSSMALASYKYGLSLCY